MCAGDEGNRRDIKDWSSHKSQRKDRRVTVDTTPHWMFTHWTNNCKLMPPEFQLIATRMKFLLSFDHLSPPRNTRKHNLFILHSSFLIPPTYALGQCLRHSYSPDTFRGARGRRATHSSFLIPHSSLLIADCWLLIVLVMIISITLENQFLYLC